MELISLYQFDPTGVNPANKVVNQSLTVIPPKGIRDYTYVIPRGAPFFADSLVVKDGINPGARTLQKDVDYYCLYDFLSVSIKLKKRVCVGIGFYDPGYNGTIYVSYQALGGNYSLADFSIMEELVRNRYVARNVSYEQIINLPAAFAPDWHEHTIGDLVGMSQVVTKLDEVKQAIASKPGSWGQLEAQLSNHLQTQSAAHTPSAVGLGNVKNYGVATLTDIQNKAVKYVTADNLNLYVGSQINSFKNGLTGFITNSDLTNTLSGYITNAGLTSTLSGYATNSGVTSLLTNYATNAYVNDNFRKIGDSYSKQEVNNLIANNKVNVDLSGYVLKADLNTTVSNLLKYTVRNTNVSTTLSGSDFDGKTIIRCTNSPGVIGVTVPPAPASFPVGAVVSIRRCGADVTILAGAGAYINPSDSLDLRRPGITATLMNVGGGNWDLISELG